MADGIWVATGTERNPKPSVKLPSDAQLCIVRRYNVIAGPDVDIFDCDDWGYDFSDEEIAVNISFRSELHNILEVLRQQPPYLDVPRFTPMDVHPKIDIDEQVRITQRRKSYRGCQVHVTYTPSESDWFMRDCKSFRLHAMTEDLVERSSEYHCIGVLDLQYGVKSSIPTGLDLRNQIATSAEQVFAIVVQPRSGFTTKAARS
jgi:hypothetical protein